jgi:hypothetical protein
LERMGLHLNILNLRCWWHCHMKMSMTVKDTKHKEESGLETRHIDWI